MGYVAREIGEEEGKKAAWGIEEKLGEFSPIIPVVTAEVCLLLPIADPCFASGFSCLPR